MNWSVVMPWILLAFGLVMLVRGWREWREGRGAGTMRSGALYCLIFVSLLSRDAPAPIRYASLAAMMAAGLWSFWAMRKSMSRKDPVMWFFGAFVVLIVFIEIGADYYSFLRGTPLKVLLGLLAVTAVAMFGAMLMPLIRVTEEARQLIKDTRLKLAELDPDAAKKPAD